MIENILYIIFAVMMIICLLITLGGCMPTTKGDKLSSDIADNIKKGEPTPSPEYTIGDSVKYFEPVYWRGTYEIIRDPNTDVLYYYSKNNGSFGALTMLVKADGSPLTYEDFRKETK